MNIEIKKSQSHKLIQVVNVTIIAFLLMMLSSYILGAVRSTLPFELPTARLILRIIILLVAAGAIFTAWLQNRYKSYSIKDGKLEIRNTFVGTKVNKQVISLNSHSVTKASVRQTLAGKILDYGDVIIEVDRSSTKDVYKLENIESPSSIAKLITNKSKS